MKRILAALDTGDEDEKVIDYAVQLASDTGAKVILMHTEPHDESVAYVTAPMMNFAMVDVPRDNEIIEKKREQAKQWLSAKSSELKKQHIETESCLMEEPLVQAVITAAADKKADLIIIGSHRHGHLYHALFGNTHEALLKRIDIPLLVVPE